MASLSKRRSTGSYSIQFEDRDRRRRTIILGKLPKRDAEAVRIRVERLVSSQLAGTAPDAETSRWLSTCGERMFAKLSRVGLVENRAEGTLGAFIDAWTTSRKADTKIRASTIAASESTHKSLRAYFGEGRPLRSITRGEAKAWRVSIAADRAENTVRKWTANAKKLFNAAIEHELIEVNPFAKLPATTIEVRDRQYFITRAEAAKVMDACPSLEWRLIFALARYGGLPAPPRF
ncbi:hypothetical protein Mal64_34570 [Pseudobythopirellula maris]|uniref:Core-binding (CB) domain-containing protein n=1 Tax=Pseudobythopirellula maris TaxID=2527991 RepID=A0A5C5ZHJ0_9BACT|nr:hypothetical protein [Pseudobythopirellula maris]TWT86628.1 hypothetical protein Mal64_34570 [Pseudobythopirellula maris]